MITLLVALNIFFVVVIFFWASYNAHISERRVNRFSFGGIAFAAIIVLLTYMIPNTAYIYNHDYFYETFVWQRILFNAAFALKCVADFYCHYGTEKWKDAFTNSKKKLLHVTNRI